LFEQSKHFCEGVEERRNRELGGVFEGVCQDGGDDFFFWSRGGGDVAGEGSAWRFVVTMRRITIIKDQQCGYKNVAKGTDLATWILPFEIRKDGSAFLLRYVYFLNSRCHFFVRFDGGYLSVPVGVL